MIFTAITIQYNYNTCGHGNASYRQISPIGTTDDAFEAESIVCHSRERIGYL